MKTVFFAIITILVLVISVASNVYAQSASTDSASLAKVNVGLFNITENSPTLVISGIVYKVFSQNIVLTIFNPQNQLISVSQLQPRLNGTFSQSIIASDPLWPKGNYTVRVASGSQNLTESIFYFPGIDCCKRIITLGVQDQLSNSTNPLSPLKQFKSGTNTGFITCKSGFYFVLKSYDREPLCLKAGTISKLASRGFLFATSTSNDNHATVIISPGSENQASPNTYSPNIITVVLGVNNTVQWVNQANVANTIVPDMPLIQNGKSFGSDGVIKPDQSYTFTFTEPGTFAYHTKPHPWMKGTVIVLPPSNQIKNVKTTIFDTGIHPFSINVVNTNFTLYYNISGNNKLLDANMDSSTKSLVLSMSASSNGTLSISIPRSLLDSKSAYSNQDMKFIILIDKQEVKYTETTSITARTLTIPFELGAKKIEITAPVNI